jgi:hypothetical protein
MASRILSKSTSDGVQRQTELNYVLGAFVHGSSVLKEVVLGFQWCIENIGCMTKMTFEWQRTSP